MRNKMIDELKVWLSLASSAEELAAEQQRKDREHHLMMECLKKQRNDAVQAARELRKKRLLIEWGAPKDMSYEQAKELRKMGVVDLELWEEYEYDGYGRPIL